LDLSIAVPAVIKVCRPQSRHPNKRGRLFNAAKRLVPQVGQRKPPGQRRLNMKARAVLLLRESLLKLGIPGIGREGADRDRCRRFESVVLQNKSVVLQNTRAPRI
jgi:hypothetical protein